MDWKVYMIIVISLLVVEIVFWAMMRYKDDWLRKHPEVMDMYEQFDFDTFRKVEINGKRSYIVEKHQTNRHVIHVIYDTEKKPLFRKRTYRFEEVYPSDEVMDEMIRLSDIEDEKYNRKIY